MNFRNIIEVALPTIELTLALICWVLMVYYVIERIREIKNEN